MAIDVGPGASDRASQLVGTLTIVDLNNPANATGTITSVEIWMKTSAAGLGFRVGTFYLVSGTTYKCRDSHTIGDVTAGSKQTFSGISGFDVTTGDFIGCYYGGSGNIEEDSSGYLGVYYASGEYIDPDDSTSYTLLAGDAISIYGTGTEAGGQTFYQALTATAIGVGALATILTATKTLAATGIGVATLTKTPTYVEALAATAIGTATLLKKCYVTLTATATGLPSLVKTVPKTLEAVAVGVAGLTTALIFPKTLAAVAVGVPFLSRAATYVGAHVGHRLLYIWRLLR